ncbi:hypothetical protein [Legionella fallonii]|uniref:Uncharacterized protein n=1 Tax=Legionella fallonii LLAP-10 TaxID=1212491 RepID=A0A098G9F1_9GAMM|nr:hypothetical protein [Legionella fallonii]CEG58639.1 exported protein of unknown function [Legionella fallonii LLAP-10]
MIIRAFLCLFLVSNAYSENIVICPSVGDIKNNAFHNWLPLYIDGEELASQEDAGQFIRGVKTFLMAKWDVTYLETGHCFYGGDPITNKIILAHDAWRPQDNFYWHWINRDKLAECNAPSPEKCSFLE